MPYVSSNAADQIPRRFCILGTAGHIDHGKSAIVKALTGTDPDRLPEEQARGMTIELGFAHLRLPLPEAVSLAGGTADATGSASNPPSMIDIGIVDVPGHERFIRTMVAGATGIDLGMLVVAADDGVMPQTREHVEILDLLGVHSGLITLSKMDLVPADRLETVRQDVQRLVESTALRDWPIVPSSAKTRQGLDDLCAVVARLAAGLTAREAGSVFRLAIDRVFAIHGRGTVVTGSVLAGRVAAGATLELQPVGLSGKVRETQSYGAAVQNVGAGQRAALNLTGLDREKIDHGMELATPGYLTPARYLDARVRLLGRRSKPFTTHQRVRVCLGTTEAIAMLVVVGDKQIAPDGEALAQLRFSRPVVAAFGQRFILRNENAQETLGGGRILRPVSRRFRVTHPEEIDALGRAEAADAYDRYTEAIHQAGFEGRAAPRLACEIGVSPEDIPALARRLEQSGILLTLAGRTLHRGTVEAIEQRALAYLKRHHAANPQEPGLLRDRFVGWLEQRTAPQAGKAILARLEGSGRILASGPYVAHRDFRPALSPEDAALLERLVKEITSAGFDSPLWPALQTTAALSKQRSKMLEDLARCESRLTLIAPQHFLSTAAVVRLKEAVRRLGHGRAFKLAEVRDALNLSRRVVQPMLEYLDRIQFTKRVGDERVLL